MQHNCKSLLSLPIDVDFPIQCTRPGRRIDSLRRKLYTGDFVIFWPRPLSDQAAHCRLNEKKVRKYNQQSISYGIYSSFRLIGSHLEVIYLRDIKGVLRKSQLHY